ncbi:MAG TPA: prepilin-type N-terminal cleavage/methylation domain-containing protein [Thermoanaerobaculia bacterium]
MKTNTISRRQDGFTLAEVLVATAIFTIMIVAGLLIYDRSNRVFKTNVEAADVQQSSRAAFDQLVSDIRMAGYDFDRDGFPNGTLAATWTPSFAYQVGNLIQPASADGFTYVCTRSGYSGPSAPTWDVGTITEQNVAAGQTAAQWIRKEVIQYQQPDEQFEYINAGALTFRANFNFETATGPCPTNAVNPCENGREPTLETNNFPVVTTGNEEIVTYALVSNSGNASANQDHIKFYADVRAATRRVEPSTKTKEDLVDISGVDLTNNYPPYTLYRITLAPTTAAPVRTPIADNVRSLKFRYFTDTAATAANEIGPNGCTTFDATTCAHPMQLTASDTNDQYDPTNPDATRTNRDVRTTIKAVRIALVGMNASPDGSYTEPLDVTNAAAGNATKEVKAALHYRQYSLESMVIPRNMNAHGMKELTTTAPGRPILDTVCYGACNAVYLTWEPPHDGGSPDTYNILYDQGACNGADTDTYSIVEDAGNNVSGYASKIGNIGSIGQTWRFAIQAINKFGQSNSTCKQIIVLNNTTPSAPADLSATSDMTSPSSTQQTNQVTLKWTPVKTNNPAIETCDDGSTHTYVDPTTQTVGTIPPAERVYYRVYRSRSNTFTVPSGGSPTLPAGVVLVLNEYSSTQPAPDVDGKMKFVDNVVGDCQSYYYRIQSVNYCARNAAYNVGADVSKAMSVFMPNPSATAPNNLALLGNANTTQTPAKVANVSRYSESGTQMSGSLCTAVSGNSCNVTVQWDPVTKDSTGVATATIPVDQYQIVWEQYNALTTTWVAVSQNTLYDVLPSNVTRYTLPGLDPTNLYRISVKAISCNTGAASDYLYWPCPGGFGGGSVSVQASQSYGGGVGAANTAANPEIIQSPSTLTVITGNNVGAIAATLTQGGSVATATVSGSGTTWSVAIPAITADASAANGARVHITITDSNGCKESVDYYVMDEPPPSCSLKGVDSDSTVLAYDKGQGKPNPTSTITLKNTSGTDAFTLTQITIKWNPSAGKNSTPSLDSVKFCTDAACTGSVAKPSATQTVSQSCAITNTTSTAVITIPTTPTNVNKLTAGQTDYTIAVNWNSAMNQGQPITGICVSYVSKFGDVLRCTISPNSSNTCTLGTTSSCP